MSTIYVNGTKATETQIYYGDACVQLESITGNTVTFSIGPRGRKTSRTLGLQALCVGRRGGPTLDECDIVVRRESPANAPKRFAGSEPRAVRTGT